MAASDWRYPPGARTKRPPTAWLNWPTTDPTPDFAAEVSDQLRRRLEQLDDQTMRQIVLRKLEGYTNREIAKQLAVSLRSVERRLALIRGIWMET